jgi:hypothetical protein
VTKSPAEMEWEVEVMTAEREVENARARLDAGLEAASATGRNALAKIKSQAKPIAIGLAIVGGIALVAGTVRLIRGAFSRPRPFRLVQPFTRPSPVRQIFGAALTSAASALVSAATRRAVREIDSTHDKLKAERRDIRYS